MAEGGRGRECGHYGLGTETSGELECTKNSCRRDHYVLQFYSKSGRQLIGSLNAASNISGVLTDTVSFSALLHKYRALSLWDFASAAPYVKIDMNPLVLGSAPPLSYVQ